MYSNSSLMMELAQRWFPYFFSTLFLIVPFFINVTSPYHIFSVLPNGAWPPNKSNTHHQFKYRLKPLNSADFLCHGGG